MADPNDLILQGQISQQEEKWKPGKCCYMEPLHRKYYIPLPTSKGKGDATDILARMSRKAVKTSLFPGISNLGRKLFFSSGSAREDPTTNPEIMDNIWVSSLNHQKSHFSSVYHFRIQTLQKNSLYYPLERSITATLMLQ